MLDNDFCEILEHKISHALANIHDEKVKGFWCDGVLLSEPDMYYSPKFINDNRQTKLKAFIGHDGQTAYSLLLKFGSKALSRYARNLELASCIPQTGIEEWFCVDTTKKEIEIQLS
jgi:hypothetical protein